MTSTTQTPNRETLIRIGETAKLVGVSTSTIRHWEKLELVQPYRIQGRNRLFTFENIEQLRRIKHLRQVDGLNFPAIHRVLRESGEEKTVRPKRSVYHPGSRIAEARRRQNLTLRQLAGRCHLSASYLSALEHGNVNASLGTLHKVAKALGLTSLELHNDAPNSRQCKLVCPEDRVRMESRGPDITLELLAKGARQLEPHFVSIPPGGGSGDAYTHPGEEFLYVLEGTIEVVLDEVNIYRLQAGDALTFSSEIAHRLHNPGTTQAKGIWVNTPPTF